MSHLVSKITNISIAFIVAVFSVNIMGVMSVSASHQPGHAPGGNNGTLKVHELGTPAGSEDPNNDPKVCKFNFEGLGFDDGQDGYIVLATQPGGIDTLTIPFGPADADGYAETVYVNNGGLTIPNGQYKSTLYGKDINNPNLPGEDLKAKSKVFKVDCPTQVTPAAPTSVDLCDTASDTYTIPTTEGVKYQINGNTVAAGAYPGSGTVTITAVADPNYELTGTTQWMFTFTMIPCIVITPVTPAAATNVDLCSTANDTYTIPATPGVIYLVNGVPTEAGTYPGTGNIVVTTMALPLYELTGTTSWNFSFTNVACPPVPVTPTAPTKFDICGKTSDTYTIPSTTGVTYKVNNVIKAAGTYAGSGLITITATADQGYVLQGTKIWIFLFTNLPCVVIPAEPTKVDICGKQNDTYTIPSTTGVKYYVNGVEKAAGTYQTNTSVLIVAVAKSGYVLDIREQLIWVFSFTNIKCAEPCHEPSDLQLLTFRQDDDGAEDCIPVGTTPGVPTNDDVCGTENDTYTIPSTTGVIYKINGEVVDAGEYPAAGSVTITAVAAEGYVIGDAVTEWTLEFPNDDACPAPEITATAVCSNDGVVVTLTNAGNGDGSVFVNGEAVEVPAESEQEVIVPFDALLFSADVLVESDDEETVLINKSFDCTPGQGGVNPPAQIVTPAAVPLAPATGLPKTGADTLAQLITMVTLAIAAYGASFYALNRRKLSDN